MPLKKLIHAHHMASEVGYFKFITRYLSRTYSKTLKRDQRMELFNGLTLNLPYDSQFGTELFLKQDLLDWGGRAVTHPIPGPGENLPGCGGKYWLLQRAGFPLFPPSVCFRAGSQGC